MAKRKTQVIFEQLSKIQRNWDLSSAQMADLLHVSALKYSDWVVAERNSCAVDHEFSELNAAESLISIHQRLAERLPREQDQIRWMFTENKDLNGRRPIDIAMSSLDNLYWLNYYLGTGVEKRSAIRPASAERTV